MRFTVDRKARNGVALVAAKSERDRRASADRSCVFSRPPLRAHFRNEIFQRDTITANNQSSEMSKSRLFATVKIISLVPNKAIGTRQRRRRPFTLSSETNGLRGDTKRAARSLPSKTNLQSQRPCRPNTTVCDRKTVFYFLQKLKKSTPRLPSSLFLSPSFSKLLRRSSSSFE